MMERKWNIEILTMKEFAETYGEIFKRSFAAGGTHYMRFCKAENLNRAVAGTFAIPAKKRTS